MPLDPLLCQTTGTLAKLIRRGARYDAGLGGVDGSKIGMNQYLIKIAPTSTSGNKARYSALRKQLLEAV